MFMKTPLVFLLLLGFVSCKEISFEQPQPKGKKALIEVPKKLHGKYLTEDARTESVPDTLVIFSKGYRVSGLPKENSSEPEQEFLGDSLVLKYFKGYYFVNVNDNPEWLLRVLKVEKNGDITCMALDQEGKKFNEFLQSLAQEIKVDSFEVNGDMLYQIDPKPKELVRLIEKGFFKKATWKKIR